MHVSPDPITTLEQAARERDSLLDFFARGLYCTMTTAVGGGDGHGEPSEEALGSVFGCDQQMVRVRSLSQIIEARR